jgi:ferredoxin
MTTDEPLFNVSIPLKGMQFNAAPGQSLLEAARMAGIALPNSCRNGTCRTCMCKLHQGHVEYRIEWPGLSREEKAEGYILPCVAYAQSDLVLDTLAASWIKTD